MARLARNTVIASAFDLADEDGLDAVTIRRLADRLGVTPMALYRHVTDKSDLLDGLAEELYGRLDLPDPKLGWWDALAALAHSVRAMLLERPWAAPLFSRPLAGPNGHALDEALTNVLLDAGFSAADTRELHDQLTNMVFALITPELRERPNRAAFERGLELLRGGLEARLAAARLPRH